MKNQIKISIVFFFCVTVLFVVMLVKRDFQEPKKQEKFQKSMAFVFEHDENYSLSNWDISSLTGWTIEILYAAGVEVDKENEKAHKAGKQPKRFLYKLAPSTFLQREEIPPYIYLKKEYDCVVVYKFTDRFSFKKRGNLAIFEFKGLTIWDWGNHYNKLVNHLEKESGLKKNTLALPIELEYLNDGTKIKRGNNQ